MKLTKRQKEFLYSLLNTSYMPGACDSYISEYLEGGSNINSKKECWREFKKVNGITITTALRWWKKFMVELEKDVRR